MLAPSILRFPRQETARPFKFPMENLELILERRWRNELCALGVLSGFTSGPICYSLEDTDRDLDSKMSLEEIQKIKVWGKTAIPYGRYRILMLPSPHFGKEMPHLVDVPGFKNIMIHPGNGPQDTDGCILVGKNMTLDTVYDCADVFKQIVALIVETNNGGAESWIDIRTAA